MFIPHLTISLSILHKLLVCFTFLHASVGWILETCPLLIGISPCFLHTILSPCKVSAVCLNVFFRNLWHVVTLISSVYELPLLKNDIFPCLFCCLQFKMQLSSFHIICSSSFPKSVLNQFNGNFHFVHFKYSHCLACVTLATLYFYMSVLMHFGHNFNCC